MDQATEVVGRRVAANLIDHFPKSQADTTSGGFGPPPGILRQIVRSVLWIVDGLPFLNLVGFITALATKHNQRVGDLVAGTYVVRDSATGRPLDESATAGAPPAARAASAP